MSKKDPNVLEHVSSLLPAVRRYLGVALLAMAFAGGAACGGKGKTDTKTPGKGSDSNQSMKDTGDPTGGGNVANTGGGNTGGGNTGGGNTGGGNTGGGNTGGGGGTTDVPFTPPNYDPDPATVKGQVDQNIAQARAALAQANPDADGALRAARAALALDAANVEAASYVAFAYYHKKLLDTAELVLDDLYKRESAKQNANVYYVYGLIYDKTNRPDRANAAFKRAVELDGRHASALVNLGVYQLKNSQYTEAQGTFERLTKEFNRNDAITLTSLGSAYRGRSGQYPKGAPERDQFVRNAETTYKRALSASAAYGPAYYNLGLLYLDTDPVPGRHRRGGSPDHGEELLRAVQECGGLRHQALREPGEGRRQGDQTRSEKEETVGAHHAHHPAHADLLVRLHVLRTCRVPQRRR